MTFRSKARHITIQDAFLQIGTRTRIVEGVAIAVLPGREPLTPMEAFEIISALVTLIRLSGRPAPGGLVELRDRMEQDIRAALPGSKIVK